MNIRYIIVSLMMMISLSTYAQTDENATSEDAKKSSEEGVDFGRNELKLSLFGIAASTIDITYERLLKSNTSIGMTGAYCFNINDPQGGDQDFIWAIIPHYRVYFGKKQAAGFFIEANAIAAETREVRQSYSYDEFNNWISKSIYYDNFGYGIGFAVGAKFLTAKGLIGEVFGGAGRYLNKKDYMPDIYPRAGVLVGKRF